MKHKKYKWLITISGYGSIVFKGTAREAEKFRKDKANWEGGIGSKEKIK